MKRMFKTKTNDSQEVVIRLSSINYVGPLYKEHFVDSHSNKESYEATTYKLILKSGVSLLINCSEENIKKERDKLIADLRICQREIFPSKRQKRIVTNNLNYFGGSMKRMFKAKTNDSQEVVIRLSSIDYVGPLYKEHFVDSHSNKESYEATTYKLILKSGVSLLINCSEENIKKERDKLIADLETL